MIRSKIVIVFLFLISSPLSSFATHLMGSEIQYNCIGNGQYEIYLRVYRDCNGIAVSQSDLMVHSTDTTFAISNQTKISVSDITDLGNVCTISSRCAGGSFPYGIEEHVWKMTMDLSSYSACEWTLSWEQNARNGNITTGQSGQNFYTEATFNKCLAPCNSSPIFKTSPTAVALVCHGREVSYDYGALDTVDHDSISYHLVPALISANTSATYSGSFTYDKPINFWGFPNKNLAFPAGFHFSNSTGLLEFRPITLNQVGVLVVEAREWRLVNGSMQIIGTTRRDMQIAVISCPNNDIPDINPPYAKKVCAGSQVCIPIITSDPDVNDTVRISWDNGISGAIFTNNNGQVKWASGEVCWTPTVDDVSSNPHTFKITAKDDDCIRSGETIRSFSIYVFPQDSVPEADLSYKHLGCGAYEISHTNQKTYTNYSLKYKLTDSSNNLAWASLQRIDTVLLSSGVYHLSLDVSADNHCSFSTSKYITVQDTTLVGNSYSDSICEGQSASLSIPTLPGQSPNFTWLKSNTLGNLIVLGKGANWNTSIGDLGPYYALDTFNNCIILDTINLIQNPNPVVNIYADKNSACVQQANVQFGDSSNLSPGQIAYSLWTFGDGDSTVNVNPIHNYLSKGNYLVSYKVVSTKGCSDSATLAITIVDNPVLLPLVNQTISSSQLNAQFSVGVNNPQYQYQWQVDTGTGFLDLSNDAVYNGVDSSVLLLQNLTKSMDSLRYRCNVSVANCVENSTTAQIIWTSGTGINRQNKLDLIIYPNPANDAVFIELAEWEEPLPFEILNSTGQSIYQGSLESKNQKLNLSSWPRGIYFIRFEWPESSGFRIFKQ